MKKKYALAVHHLNIAYAAGNEPSYHRQLREGIIPLLDLLERYPHWCFSIEMSGLSIEFIGQSYPSVLKRFRTLIENGQIELISCTYAPQIWICFPRHDMIQSIEYNLKILKEYELPLSRIFFAQENFSGEGMKTLTEWFDIGVVKDDYYYYLHESDQHESTIPPYFMLGEMKLMVGWGHLLEGLSAFIKKREVSLNQYVQMQHQQIIQDVLEKKRFKTSLSGYIGKCKDIEWQWYHIGSSERFAKSSMQPQSLSCRFDPEWYSMAEQMLLEYEKEGFEFSGIQDFIHDVESTGFQPEPCKPLLDGAWNMENSRGGFIWMGLNSNGHEDDLLVRNQNWISRSQLLGAEAISNIYGDRIDSDRENDELKKLRSLGWKHQLLAETSDSTGWHPDSMEVFYSIMQSEQVLNISARITSLVKCAAQGGTAMIDVFTKHITEPSFYWKDIAEISIENSFITNIHLIGAEGGIRIFQSEKRTHVQRIIIDFTPNDTYAGLEIGMETDRIIYSPALMDDTTVCYRLSEFKPDLIYLPLPNGLIGMKQDLYLIKHNEFMNIACCIDRAHKKIRFAIENPKKQNTHWVMTVFQGGAEEAVALANKINIWPDVWI